jgi:hypothetical protein
MYAAFLRSVAVTSVLALCLAGCGLSRRERAAIDAEKAKLSQAESRIQAIQAEVGRDLQAEPALFSAGSRDTSLRQRLEAAKSSLGVAKQNLAKVEELGKRGRGKPGSVEQGVREVEDARSHAVSDAEAVVAEAARGMEIKRNLAAQLQEMENERGQIEKVDLAPLQAAIARAEADWPDKKSDLENRLSAVMNERAQAEVQLPSAQDGAVDYAAVYSTEESLRAAAAGLPNDIANLTNLSGQLYYSWDKILEDLDQDRQGNRRIYQEKLKTVRTHLIDVAAQKSETSSAENWQEVPEATYRSMENDLGMTIEHKAAGRYDSEAEHVAQPPGYAYIATPEQGRNQYGYWEHRDGGSFWTFLPQYLIMRELFWGPRYQPIPTMEWRSYYSARSQGQTYYGHDTVTNAPKYGSHGTFTATRYGNSRYIQTGGGFGKSKYASGSSSNFGSSRYSSGAPKSSGSFSSRDPAGHRFGSGSSSSGRSFGSSRPSRSPGRSFGRRR